MFLKFWMNALVFAGVLILPACFSEQKKDGLVVINVLDQDLYEDCHIKGSIHIPFETIEEKAAKTIDKSAEIVIYCSNYQCSTSEYAARKLAEQGFDRVSVYEGGTAEWCQLGLPVEGPSKKAYLKRVCEKTCANENCKVPIITAHVLADKMNMKTSQKRAA